MFPTPQAVEQGRVDYIAAKLCGDVNTIITHSEIGPIRIWRTPWTQKYSRFYAPGRPLCICRVYLPNGTYLMADASAESYPWAFAWALLQAEERVQEWLKRKEGGGDAAKE
jgi:hypothetical protein